MSIKNDLLLSLMREDIKKELMWYHPSNVANELTDTILKILVKGLERYNEETNRSTSNNKKNQTKKRTLSPSKRMARP